jgi:hypothetical protein
MWACLLLAFFAAAVNALPGFGRKADARAENFGFVAPPRAYRIQPPREAATADRIVVSAVCVTDAAIRSCYAR